MLSFFFTADAIGAPPRIGSVILNGNGMVFSLNPKIGNINKKCAK